MIELYKRINDRTINKTVKKIMKRTRKDDWKYFRIGVEMRGGDITLAKKIIVRELEFMNTKPYEELLTYHPQKFMKALAGTKWSKTALECYPGASYEYVYIGKYLSSYKDENGLLDMELVNRDFELIECNILSYSKGVCEKSIIEKTGIQPELEVETDLLSFFPHASNVCVCNKTKTIAVFLDFKVMFYAPDQAQMRLDWERYKPEYYIEDHAILNRQLNKAEVLSKNLNIPGKEDPASFIWWANTDVTTTQIKNILTIYSSIACGSLQYYKECKSNLLKSQFDEKYNDYILKSVITIYDPFVGNKRCNVANYRVMTDDFSNNQTYKELYE